MRSSTTDLQYAYRVVLCHPTRPQVLLWATPEGWSLPRFSRSERQLWQEVGVVNRWLAETLAAPAFTLRCMALDYHPEAEVVSLLYAASLRDPAWSPPPQTRWVGTTEFAEVPLADPTEAAQIQHWFAWHTSVPAPTGRVPWYRPGWHEPALQWATAILAQADLPLIGPVEQIRSWQRSAMLCLPTPAGPVYFKAVPPIFAHEPALTAALAATNPGRVPPVVATDPARGWLLMRELPGPTLDQLRDETDLPTWAMALAAFAELQLAAIPRLDRLRQLGLPARSLTNLSTQLAPLLADHTATLPDRPAGLSAQDRVSLATFATQAQPMVDELASYGLPLTLEHGDFWPGQVVLGPQGPGFLDWSDCTLAHPFFSLLLFLVEIEDFFPRSPGVREWLRDAYLEPWRTARPGIPLTRAFELAQPLAALHHALSYYHTVLPALEVPWELELMLPFYLKMALRLAPTA